MDKNKTVNILRFLLIPVPLTLYFIYFCYTNKGPVITNYIVGFIFFAIIVASVIFNLLFFKIGKIVRFAPETPTVLNGINGKAILKSVNYTNRRVNKYPVYEILLDISVEGNNVYEIKRSQLATPVILTKLIIGKEYSALIDTADRNIVQIEELEKYY